MTNHRYFRYKCFLNVLILFAVDCVRLWGEHVQKSIRDIQIVVLWVVTLCSLVGGYSGFGEIFPRDQEYIPLEHWYLLTGPVS
jgi:hypothetical protein